MSDKPTLLRTVDDGRREDVVETIESMLERAQDSGPVEFFGLLSDQDGNIEFFWAPSGDLMKKIGALEVMKFKMLNHMRGEE